MFTVVAGAAVQGLLMSLAVKGIGSCWIGSTIAAAATRDVLGLPDDWRPRGAIAVGHSLEPLTPRAVAGPGDSPTERRSA